MAYETYGEGTALLILHGWGANKGVMRGIAEHLSSRYHTIALDFPGFGESPEPPDAWDLSAYADFVFGFLRAQNINEVVLLGHSFGGRVIIKMMEKLSRGEQTLTVKKIVLTDAAGIKPKRTFKQNIQIRAYKTGKAFLQSGIGKALFPGKLEDLQSRSGSADYRAATPLMRQVLVKAVNEDLTPVLSLNTVETLLIWGELDTDTPLVHGQTMERLMPKAGLAVIKGAGHFAFINQPALFYRILDAFL